MLKRLAFLVILILLLAAALYAQRAIDRATSETNRFKREKFEKQVSRPPRKPPQITVEGGKNDEKTPDEEKRTLPEQVINTIGLK